MERQGTDRVVLVVCLALAVLSAPLVAVAQAPAKVFRNSSPFPVS